ncbi:MAG: TIGR03086 family protein [Nocardioides sp.]|nr:TIGR03086 family protein [Nocardioides sp.]
MTQTLPGSVELLDRALGYTRARLAVVHSELLCRPTPCEGWTLADLLAHLEDGLDAFSEAAGGAVEVRGGSTAAGRLDSLRDKARGLIAAWSEPTPGDVVIETAGMHVDLAAPTLVATAALEVTVHGWDVGQSTGERTAIPANLAQHLLPIAHGLVGAGDRGARFARARPVPAMAPYDQRLLGFLGRT